ncbi:leucine-rich repeat-containing protein kinase family protein [Alkalimarinus alittae]|uniref:Leucine-rich repeat-containing serine/threonine-protein kinase n=1 Tax=Alkalimarinus alittae TaxID=2961619 RepID=A0ABY6N085_9ALTE|nr:leucine-rich repeat-containing protein kinase family protein [Alkalimarinus alittae]UZE95503.1 leucine-rich repeat-containing serine/threonine-protein kinase [Alkalimarinus alittae]
MQTLEQLKSGQLKGIKRLQLVEGLTMFPTEIFELADTLEVLDLSNNQLDSLPADLGRLKNLKILFLSNNKFKHLPAELAGCPELEMIGFKANQIKRVPEDCLPTKTRWLILTENQIERLPESMGRLHRLKKLALAGNQLTSLPDSMADCQNLELVRLSANQLTHLPDWLFQLPKLSWLAFAGNPIGDTPACQNSTMPQVSMSDLEMGRKIGEGASGVISCAKWINQPESLNGSDLEVAIKVFKGHVTSDGYPKDELANCLKAGEHSNLIKVVAQVAESDQLALVMKLIPDTFYNLGLPPSLETCTRDTFNDGIQFSADEIANVTTQMAEMLAHLHQNGVSHGDVYAHNTMIDDNASVLFGDFGAASNVHVLPVAQQKAMEAIEVRAFGCLLDDLLALNESDDNLELVRLLSEVRDRSMAEAVGSRPSFNEIKEYLNQVC